MSRKAFLKHFTDYNQSLRHRENRLFNISSFVSNLNLFNSFKSERKLSVELWAKFDEVNFDGFSVFARLLKDNKGGASSASCSFSVYYVSQGNSWSKTLVTQSSGVVVQDGYKLDVTSGIPDSVGDYTFYVECEIIRSGVKYRKNGYFNHFYTLEQTTRNRNKIRFLEVTKVDE